MTTTVWNWSSRCRISRWNIWRRTSPMAKFLHSSSNGSINHERNERWTILFFRQTKQMAKLHLNDSKKKTSHPKISSWELFLFDRSPTFSLERKCRRRKIIQWNTWVICSLIAPTFALVLVETLSYLEFSSPKVPSKTVSSPVAHSDLRSLHLQVRYSLEQIFAVRIYSFDRLHKSSFSSCLEVHRVETQIFHL